MNRLRIVHIITGLKTGGAEAMLASLVKQSDKDRFEHIVISLTTLGEYGEGLSEAGLQVVALRLSKWRPWRFFRLVRWLKEINPDIVQTWLYLADLIGGVAAKIAGCRNISWGVHHSNLVAGYNERSVLLTAKICALLTPVIPRRIVCCSKSALEAHRSIGYPPSKLLLIRNGIDIEKYRPDSLARFELRQELGVPETTMLVGLPARFHPLKDHLTFLQAARIVHEEYPDVHFVLCGQDVTFSNVALREWIESEHLLGHCHPIGLRSDMSRFLAAMDLVTLSSRGEALPLVLAEAMACQVPCVATDVGDVAELIGETGRVVPAGDPILLAKALIELLADVSLRVNLGILARQRVKACFSLDQAVSEYDCHFQGMLNLKRSVQAL